MLFVIVTSQSGAQQRETFSKATVVVGRVPEGNDLVLPGNAVSARHAVLSAVSGVCVIADLGSTNGTWVNGRRIDAPVALGVDDIVQIGEYSLRVEGVGPAATAAGATMAIEMPPPSRGTGISWATAKQDVPGDAATAPTGNDSGVGSWATMQAAAVNEETHGPASVRIAAPPATSAPVAAVCMSCGAELRPDTVFCQACGAKRVSAAQASAAASHSDASIGYDATGALPASPQPLAYDATAAIAAAPSLAYEPTGAMAVMPAPPAAQQATQALAAAMGMEATRAMQISDPGIRGSLAAFSSAPALVVDPSGAAGFPTIQDAVRMAPPGAVIRVRPGVYAGPVMIDKPCSIIADGGPVVMEAAAGSTLTCAAATALVQGISVRGATGGSIEPAVLISRGGVRLDHCDVSPTHGPGIVIDGAESEPSLLHCSIRGGDAEGIEIRNGARPRIDRCEIAHTGRAGICVHDGGVPAISRCSVHDTSAQGLLVHGVSAGTFDDCEIALCRLAGVDVLSSGRPTLRRCRIRDSREGCGVIVQYGGSGVFEDCVIDGHQLSAVEVREGGQPWFQRCSLVGSRIERGLYVYDRGAGVFEDCEIGLSRRHGVGARSGAQPVLRRCRIHGSIEAGGVLIYRQGGAVLEACQVDSNPGVGIDVTDDSVASLRGCRVHGNGGGALRAVANRAVHAVECEFTGGTARALSMESAAQARLERCSFAGECVCGVDCACDTTGSTFRPS